MVNVNKPICKAGAQVKPATAPQRRPRNTKLNSSRKSLAQMRKLNCSRESVIEELKGWFSPEEAEEYVNEFEDTTGAQITRLASDEEVNQYDGEFWATKDGKESLWCRHNGMWIENPQDTDAAKSAPGNLLSAMGVSGTITEELPEVKNTFEAWLQEANQKYGLNMNIESWYISDDGTLNIEYTDANDYEGADQEAFLDDYLDFVANTVVPAAAGKSERVQIVGGPDGYYNEWDTSGDMNSSCNSSENKDDAADTEKLNCSEDEADDVKIITESGNEVSLSDIKIIQDPNTNEISLFIKEDEDEEIPEGFTVIATATQAALPAADGEGAVCPECGQDPCVCEGDDNLDSSANPRQSC